MLHDWHPVPPNFCSPALKIFPFSGIYLEINGNTINKQGTLVPGERRFFMGDKGSTKKVPKMTKKEAKAAKIAARNSKLAEEA